MVDSATQGGVFALDLSTHTGWAYGHRDDDRPIGGVWELGSMANLGRVGVCLENELGDALDLLKPRVVIFESPLPARAQTHEKTARLLLGCPLLVEAECYRHDIPTVVEASVEEVRKAILGRSRFPRDEVKQVVRTWCREQGWPFSNDNLCDAALLWRYQCNLMRIRQKLPPLGKKPTWSAHA